MVEDLGGDHSTPFNARVPGVGEITTGGPRCTTTRRIQKVRALGQLTKLEGQRSNNSSSSRSSRSGIPEDEDGRIIPHPHTSSMPRRARTTPAGSRARTTQAGSRQRTTGVGSTRHLGPTHHHQTHLMHSSSSSSSSIPLRMGSTSTHTPSTNPLQQTRRPQWEGGGTLQKTRPPHHPPLLHLHLPFPRLLPAQHAGGVKARP